MNTIDRLRMGLFTVLAASAVSIVVGSNAMALSVDFADGTWIGAAGKSTHYQDGITLSALPSPSAKITVNVMDGLGINDDEITFGTERLKIAFNELVTLHTVEITDLFKDGPLGISEVGSYSLNGGSFINTFSSVGGPNGAVTVNINATDVSYITFRARLDLYSDYSVKGLTYTAKSVPEPSALLLLGAGLVGLAAWRRILAA